MLLRGILEYCPESCHLPEEGSGLDPQGETDEIDQMHEVVHDQHESKLGDSVLAPVTKWEWLTYQ